MDAWFGSVPVPDLADFTTDLSEQLTDEDKNLDLTIRSDEEKNRDGLNEDDVKENKGTVRVIQFL